MPLEIPVLYLMVVLRIADYLHAGVKRAPKEREQADRLRSRVSHREYAWNQAVYNKLIFRFTTKEVYVTAEPESSEVYQSLEA